MAMLATCTSTPPIRGRNELAMSAILAMVVPLALGWSAIIVPLGTDVFAVNGAATRKRRPCSLLDKDGHAYRCHFRFGQSNGR